VINTVETLPEVKEFLAQFPEAKIDTAKWDDKAVEKNIDKIRNSCEKLPVESYWKVVAKDIEKGVSLVLWINPKNHKIDCIFQKEAIEEVTPPKEESEKESEDYVQTQCVVSAPFGCEKNQVEATTSEVQLVLRNGMGSSANVSSVAIAGCGINSTGLIMPDQSTQLVTINCASALTSGKQFNGDVSLTYKPTGGEISMKSSGFINVEVA